MFGYKKVMERGCKLYGQLSVHQRHIDNLRTLAVSCKGGPAAPRLRRLTALTGPATQPSFATKNSTARSG